MRRRASFSILGGLQRSARRKRQESNDIMCEPTNLPAIPHRSPSFYHDQTNSLISSSTRTILLLLKNWATIVLELTSLLRTTISDTNREKKKAGPGIEPRTTSECFNARSG